MGCLLSVYPCSVLALVDGELNRKNAVVLDRCRLMVASHVTVALPCKKMTFKASELA